MTLADIANRPQVSPIRPSVVKQLIAKMRTEPETASGQPTRPIDWRWAAMPAIDVTGGHLADAKLSYADLSYAWLGRTTLSRAHMVGTVLDGGNLVDAKLDRAFLLEAKLRRTDLRAADLNHATLTDADLTGCQLAGADLRDANLTGAVLSGASFIDSEIGPVTGLTQRQLDLATADPDDPPILDGVLDAETGEPLVWRGGVGRE